MYSGPITLPDAEPVGELPSCPDGAVDVLKYGLIPGGDYVAQGSLFADPGRWLQKHFVQIAGATTRIGGVAIWLDLVGR